MKNITLALVCAFFSTIINAQTCPNFLSGTTTVLANPDTYYPGTQANVAAGANSITLGTATSGTASINSGDIVLIIQMQGAEINSSNSNSYGDGVSGGNSNGYLNNTNHLAGNMEYAVAANSVPLSGGTLNLTSGTTLSYQNSNYVSGTVGQYRYQVIRVPVYYNATLGASLTAANWDGNTGGVLVIHAVNNFSFAGFSLSAAGAGFRGGGSRQLGGDAGTNTDYRTSANNDNNGPKGEGTAGTPRYLNNNGILLNTGVQGYPNGSHGRGAPGNAGGGGTDGNPSANDENSGGSGGANGGAGGRGGNSWNSNLAVGGEPSATFAQRAANRVVLGGGGGGGTTNNGTGTPTNGFASSGAAGGGIVILNAKYVTTAGTVNVNGANANNTVDNDASGGGGAGGSVLIRTTSGHSNITVLANGGNGGTNTGGGVAHGPGGGGGGGVIFSNGTLNGASTVTAGVAGTTAGSINFGAANGSNGVIVQNSASSAFPALSNGCVLLPVTLIRFKATKQGNTVLLNWTVEQEINPRWYELERSNDGMNFTKIVTIPGSNANAYNYTDMNASDYGAAVYYRLKIVDRDGQYKYSNVELVRFDGRLTIDMKPTLVRPGEKMILTITGNKMPLSVKIYNMAGQEIKTLTTEGAGTEIPTSSLVKGVYMVRVFNTEVNKTFKIAVQ